MKNPPSKIVSNSQRVRANAVWLMNAASLAIAIGAASSSDNVSIVTKAKAVAYTWGAGGSDSGIQTTANWSPNDGSNMNWSSSSSATNNTFLFGTAGTSKMTVSVKNNGNTIFGQVTFDAVGNTNSGSGWVVNDPGTGGSFQLAGNTPTTSTGSTLLNNYTAGNLTFNVQVIQSTSNNTWTTVAGANTIFNRAVYATSSSSVRYLTLNGAGNFTFNSGIKNSYITNSSQTLTTSSTLTISNTGTTTITGAMDLRGQVEFRTLGGTVVLDGDNSTVGASLTRVPGTDTTYAFRFTQGNVKLNNALALGNQDLVLGRTSGTSSFFELGVYTNAAITVANNFTLGASTGSVSVLNGYTLGGSSANTSIYSGTVLLNKDARFTQVTGGTLTFSNAITSSGSRNLTLDGEGNINITNSIGSGIIPIVGSTSTSSNRVVTLSGSNAFTTGVTINSGVLALGSSGALNSTVGSENAITWGASTSSGTLRLNGNSVVVKSLTTNATAGTPIIENANATGSILTIGNSTNADSTFAGVMRDGTGAGTLGVNKVGTGILTLSGANTYTGATTISAGTLALTGSLTGSAVTVGASGTLKGTGSTNGSLNISGTVNPGSAGVGTLTTGATDLKQGGTLNIQFFSGSGTAGSTGWDLLSTGALTTTATSGNKFNINLVSITTLGADTTGAASVFSNSSDQTFEIIRASSLATAFDASLFNLSTVGFTNSLGGGSWSLTSSNNSIYANFAKFVAGTISYWSAGTWGVTASGTGGAGSWDNASGSWDATGGKTAVFAGSSGDAVTVGTVTAKKGITFSTTGYTLSSGSIALADTSGLNTVTVDSGTATIASALTGSGGFTKAGFGTLTLSGDNNSLSGGMTIGLGTLKVGSATALGASASNVSITSGAVLDLNGTTYTNANALSIAGTGAVINSSNTAASYNGNVTLTATSSIVSTGAITLSGTTNLSGFGLTLTTGAGDITLSNNISGSGALTISPAGAGNVTLSGSSINNTGAISVNSVTGGGNTTISGNIGSSVTNLALGTVNTTGSDRTITLSGTNTYTGTTTINAGTVKLGSPSAFSTSIVTANGYGSGVAIDLNGQTIANTLKVRGTGISATSGVITNTSSTAAKVTGNVEFNGDSTIVATAGDITLGLTNPDTGALISGSLKTASATNRTITLAGTSSGGITNIYVKTGVLQTNAVGSGYIALIVGTSGSDKVKVTLDGTQVLQTNGNIKIQGGTLALATSSTLSSSGMSLNAGGSSADNSTLLLTAGNNYTFASLGNGGNLTFDTTDSTGNASITFTAGGNATTNVSYGQTGNAASKIFSVNRGVSLIVGSSGSSTFFDLAGSSAVAGTNRTLKLDGAGTYTFNSVIRDTNVVGVTGGINKTGAGNVVLNAANTYTGGTIVGAGTLKVGNATALGADASAVTVSAGATLDLNGTTMTGTNALTLSGTATNAGASAATYHGSLTLGANTATLTADANNLTFDSSSDVTGAFTLTLNGASNGSLSGALKNSTGGLNKSGAGNWTISGTNATYTGVTNITGGTLTMGASNVIGSGDITINGGTLAIGANSDTVGAVTLTDGTISGSSGVLTSSADLAASAGTISAKIGGTKGLTKTGNGLLTLSGLSTNTGVTTINGGTVSVSSIGNGGVAGNLGAASTGSANIIIDGGTLKYTGAGETSDRKIKAGTALTIDASGTGALVLSNDPYSTVTKLGAFVNTNTNSVWTLTGTNTDDNTYHARLVDNGTGVTSLVKSGTGTWVITGDISDSATVTNPFTGGTTISGGKLKATTADIRGNIVNNSVFEFTNGSALPGSYTSVISGSGLLNKSGAGAVTLTGDNTYTGVTNIKSGSLVLGSNTGKISGSSAINVFKDATLKSTNTTDSILQASAIVLNSGAIVDLTAGNLTATSLTVNALSGADVTKINFGINKGLSLTNLTLTGNLAVDLLGTPSGIGTYDVLTWSGTKSGSGTVNLLTTNTSDWVYSLISSEPGKYQIKVAVAFVNGGDLTGGTVTVPSGSTVGAVSGATTVSAAATTTVGPISGGTVNLSGANNTVGAISGGTVNLNAAGSIVASLATGGTLNVKANSTVTSLTGGNLSVDSGVNVTVNSTSAATSTAVLSGAGSLVKTGNAKLTLSGDSSTFTGAVNVAAGTLEVSSVSALGSGTGTSAALSLGTASNATAAKLSYTGGAGTISKDITALSTATAGNIVENASTAGALTLSGSLAKNGTALTLAGGTGGINVTGVISGSLSNSDLYVTGTGTVTLSQANTYNGPTFVQNTATLIANNASATGTGIVNVASGATLQVGTAANYALTLSTGGYALTNGSIIRVYVGSVNTTGLTANAGAAGFDTNYTHFDLSNNAGVTYSTLTTSGTLDLTGVTAGGITIQVYSTDAVNGTTGFEKSPFYDFKFLQAASVTHSLGGAGSIASLFTINTDNLKYSDGTTVTGAKYAGQNIADLIKMYTVTSGGNTVLMMSIPEPSTYGLGLGALALAVAAIRRRKQKKATV